MVILILESKTHNTPAAIHTVGELGITNNNAELRIAPIKKNGRRLPNLGCHVLSLK